MKLTRYHIISYSISIIILIILAVQLYNRYVKTEPEKVKKALLEPRDLDIVYGNDSAKITMYVYYSYQCEYCRKFLNEVLPKLEQAYISKNQLKVVLRITARTVGKERELALKTAVCINKYGNFTYLHQLLLSNFKVMYTEEFKEMVNEFREKDPFVGECIDGTEGKSYLTENIEEFERLQFRGTPTFVIENQVFMGYRDYKQISNIIENKL
jgi:protein-disulfide isomerase